MNKEEEIEEMAKFILKNRTGEDSEWIANGLYDMGYRKADEVRKETAKQIFDVVNELYEQANSMKGTVEFKCGALDALNDVLDIFYREYGFEVKE